MTPYPRHASRLAQLEARGRLRELIPGIGLDFASNDYLGLRDSAELAQSITDALARGIPVGSGGSRLLRGNDAEFERLETEAAAFFGADACLYMGGGFQANQAILTCLPMSGDLVLHDALVHASMHEGMRLGAADLRSFRHNDAQDAAAQIQSWREHGGKGRVWLALETLYSMDGDFAPLADFVAIARDHDATLILDEAHATGLYGVDGRGLAPMGCDVPMIVIHTCGKALGASGALICADSVIIRTLINRARPFIYATAPSPLMAAAVRHSLHMLQTQPRWGNHAAALRQHAHHAAESIGLDHHGSQIIPLIVGEDHAATRLAQGLQAAGLDLRAVRPPTVPKGTARLRISLTGGLQPRDIDTLFGTLSTLAPELTP
ncbi:8-amino-7-oxononanoate synthase [Thioclava nitratireducens]|uniref:8-amino-7-oxononanoate synthase n=1 Tax=Thioclava nitratireducens TaxID=1915078 RepID=UPI0024806C25|nr:8-amino-7-oxononanoate synthase [Thioclava nitratireducens]WGT51546.1 8-amino-7-oxononanoate synthase [Thioclava nitratireducens]